MTHEILIAKANAWHKYFERPKASVPVVKDKHILITCLFSAVPSKKNFQPIKNTFFIFLIATILISCSVSHPKRMSNSRYYYLNNPK